MRPPSFDGSDDGDESSSDTSSSDDENDAQSCNSAAHDRGTEYALGAGIVGATVPIVNVALTALPFFAGPAAPAAFVLSNALKLGITGAATGYLSGQVVERTLGPGCDTDNSNDRDIGNGNHIDGGNDGGDY